MPEFEAFVCFTNLMTAPSLLPFYRKNDKHVVQRLQLFKVMLNHRLPTLFEHLEKEGFHPRLYFYECIVFFSAPLFN